MTPKETLTKFFFDELEGLEIKTGSNQLSRIMNLPEGAKELSRLVDILVATCLQTPFDLIPVAVVMRVIQDQMIRDDSFASPPFGQLSGFNQKIVWKWLNMHWHQHSKALETKAAERPMTYEEYLDRCKNENIDPKFIITREEFGKPMTEERTDFYVKEWIKSLGNIGAPKKIHHNAMREKYGTSALKEYYASKQKFVVNGVEIYADSQEQAEQMYKETIGELPSADHAG